MKILSKLVKKFGHNELVAPKGFDKEWMIQNKSYKKTPKSREVISTTKDNRVEYTFFNEDGLSSVMVDVTLKELQTMMKKLEKDVKKFKAWNKKKNKNHTICLRHLSPDLTFVVDYSNKKVK